MRNFVTFKVRCLINLSYDGIAETLVPSTCIFESTKIYNCKKYNNPMLGIFMKDEKNTITNMKEKTLNTHFQLLEDYRESILTEILK